VLIAYLAIRQLLRARPCLARRTRAYGAPTHGTDGGRAPPRVGLARCRRRRGSKAKRNRRRRQHRPVFCEDNLHSRLVRSSMKRFLADKIHRRGHGLAVGHSGRRCGVLIIRFASCCSRKLKRELAPNNGREIDKLEFLYVADGVLTGGVAPRECVRSVRSAAAPTRCFGGFNSVTVLAGLICRTLSRGDCLSRDGWVCRG